MERDGERVQGIALRKKAEDARLKVPRGVIANVRLAQSAKSLQSGMIKSKRSLDASRSICMSLAADKNSDCSSIEQ